MHFLLLGGANQMAPINNHINVLEQALHEDSPNTLAGGNLLELTEGKRSDLTLFSFYSKLARAASGTACPCANRWRLRGRRSRRATRTPRSIW